MVVLGLALALSLSTCGVTQTVLTEPLVASTPASFCYAPMHFEWQESLVSAARCRIVLVFTSSNRLFFWECFFLSHLGTHTAMACIVAGSSATKSAW